MSFIKGVLQQVRRKLIALLFTLTYISMPVQANLINIDFSSGFTGWSVETIGTNGVNTTPASVSENLSILPMGAMLSTSNGQNEIWSVTLFQDVIFGAIQPGQSLFIDLEVSKLLTANFDFYFVQLRDLVTNDVLNMSSGGRFNLNAWIGRSATFEFGVQDADFSHPDMVSVKNIQVYTQDIPEPSAASLLLLGLAVVSRQIFSQKV